MSDIDLFDDEAPEENDEPDFVALYEPHVDGDGWQMTPRMAWRLWTAAAYLADDWRYTSPAGPLGDLPPIARPYFRDRPGGGSSSAASSGSPNASPASTAPMTVSPVAAPKNSPSTSLSTSPKTTSSTTPSAMPALRT